MTTVATSAPPVRIGLFLAPLGIWLAMAVVAVLNGVFRETVLISRIREHPGHVLSTAMLVAAILLISFAFFQWTPVDYSAVELALIGVGWTVLTVGFEFLVGYAEGTPVSVTLGQYDVLGGRSGSPSRWRSSPVPSSSAATSPEGHPDGEARLRGPASPTLASACALSVPNTTFS